ncbi:10700_t:CDS:2, partial [Scutellospora calospora]
NGRAAAIRSNYCISKETGIYYFEIDILEGGEGNLISIGVATPHFSLRRHVGYASSSYNLERLYPAVGMRCKNARVEANFGNRPFKFDIKLYAK